MFVLRGLSLLLFYPLIVKITYMLLFCYDTRYKLYLIMADISYVNYWYSVFDDMC